MSFRGSAWSGNSEKGQAPEDSIPRRSYVEEGVPLLELAPNAHVLFESQPVAEKCKLLDLVLSNCTWKDRELTAKYRQLF